MVVDSLAGIVGVILLPDPVQNHFIGVHTSGVLDEQRENIKFLDRQWDYLAPHSDKALLQAEIQITFPDFRQWLICLPESFKSSTANFPCCHHLLNSITNSILHHLSYQRAKQCSHFLFLL